MKLPLAAVDDAGIAIRALRKHNRIRTDDFALTANVSQQLMTDLENGKPTVQMGRVLKLLKSMGIRVTIELPDSVAPTLAIEQAKRERRRAATLSASSDEASDA